MGYAWINRDEVIDTDRVVAVLDAGVVNGTEGMDPSSNEMSGDKIRTVLLMMDGSIITTAYNRKTVVNWLSQGRLVKNRSEE